MPKRTSQPKGNVYVIHFWMKDGSNAHLVGFTRRADPKERLKEHRAHPETEHIKQLFENSDRQHVETIYRTVTTLHERFVAAMVDEGNHDKVCPACIRMSLPTNGKKGPTLADRTLQGVLPGASQDQ